MNNEYKKIYKEIKKYSNIVLARHIGADPDALGSQFALKELIKNKYPEKNVWAIGTPASRFKYIGTLDKTEDVLIDENTLLIVLDTPDIKRIDGVNISDYKNVIKIDHHPFIESFGGLELIDSDSSSTCQMILEYSLINKLKITNEIAENLYLGMISDTDRFLHDYTSIKTFKLVTKLLEMTNINFTSLYNLLYSKPLNEVKFEGYIFSNLNITENGVAYVKITDDLMKEYNVDSASAGNMINDLKFVNEIVAWVFFSEDKKSNLVRANIRSNGPTINKIASKYGGGGHKYASGARLTTWKQADDLIKDLDEISECYVKSNEK